MKLWCFCDQAEQISRNPSPQQLLIRVHTLLNIAIQSAEFGSARPRKNKMPFYPRNYIIVHFHTNTQKAWPRFPQQLVIKVGPTHLHAVIHVVETQLPSSSTQIAPRSGSTGGSRTTQKQRVRRGGKIQRQRSDRREQLKKGRAESGGGREGGGE